jgi:catechol 2,3-dioxygenase-like lactoylglutathione lyase family enzyme
MPAKKKKGGPLAPRAFIPFAHVADVARAVAFYETLGFALVSSLSRDKATLDWALLEHGGAQLMVARATAPVVAEEQAVLFYVYYDDVPATREALVALGLEASPLEFPDHSPRGEFRLVDPDGYAVQITHT